MAAGNDIDWQDPVHEAAAEWVVRLHATVSDAQAEKDWLAFEAWLDDAAANRDAYDAAQALWSEMDRQSGALRLGLGEGQSAAILPFPSRRTSAAPVWWAATAAAAASLLVFIGPFSPFRIVEPTVYAAAKGERRTITLNDGSQIALNSNSKASVLMDSRRREVNLAEGSEAAFTVTHDAARPFVVHVGDRTIRDLGTEFDVLRNNGALTVTVRSGLVEVAPTPGAVGQTVNVTPGLQLSHREGSATSDIARTSADDAFGWRAGRLVYRNRSLADVAADLNRYYGVQIKAEGTAAALPFSGVLALADESMVINRLTALVPVSANTQDGVIILRARTN
ncbi:MAG TPA: FecR domain-containing protein [Caulobacteraceae bacterium]|nr:FecR domain-containing protein [Caulobacteraceae bacterium]